MVTHAAGAEAVHAVIALSANEAPRLTAPRGTLAVRRAGGGGFTMIELLVALAIIGLMLALAYPRYFSSLDRSKEVVLRENLRTVRETIDKFYGDTGRYPEALDELVERKYLRAVPLDPITESTATWQLLPPTDGKEGKVYDIKSGAPGAASNGRAFSDL